MSIIDGLVQKWAEMDEIDRKNFWIAVVGVILLVVLFINLSNTMNTLGGYLGRGADYVNSTVEGVNQIGGTTQ
ncbi:MAG: hypothetical protein V1744_02255 [Candidatus Altiarchaeota archaeon]